MLMFRFELVDILSKNNFDIGQVNTVSFPAQQFFQETLL